MKRPYYIGGIFLILICALLYELYPTNNRAPGQPEYIKNSNFPSPPDEKSYQLLDKQATKCGSTFLFVGRYDRQRVMTTFTNISDTTFVIMAGKTDEDTQIWIDLNLDAKFELYLKGEEGIRYLERTFPHICDILTRITT